MSQVDMVHTTVSGGRKSAVVGYRKGKRMLDDQVFKLNEQKCVECDSALRFAERIYYKFDISDRIIELQFFCDEECAGVEDDNNAEEF